MTVELKVIKAAEAHEFFAGHLWRPEVDCDGSGVVDSQEIEPASVAKSRSAFLIQFFSETLTQQTE